MSLSPTLEQIIIFALNQFGIAISGDINANNKTMEIAKASLPLAIHDTMQMNSWHFNRKTTTLSYVGGIDPITVGFDDEYNKYGKIPVGVARIVRVKGATSRSDISSFTTDQEDNVWIKSTQPTVYLTALYDIDAFDATFPSKITMDKGSFIKIAGTNLSSLIAGAITKQPMIGSNIKKAELPGHLNGLYNAKNSDSSYIKKRGPQRSFT